MIKDIYISVDAITMFEGGLDLGVEVMAALIDELTYDYDEDDFTEEEREAILAIPQDLPDNILSKYIRYSVQSVSVDFFDYDSRDTTISYVIPIDIDIDAIVDTFGAV